MFPRCFEDTIQQRGFSNIDGNFRLNFQLSKDTSSSTSNLLLSVNALNPDPVQPLNASGKGFGQWSNHLHRGLNMKILAMSFTVMMSILLSLSPCFAQSGSTPKKPAPTEAAVTNPIALPPQPAEKASGEKSSLIVTRDYVIGPEDMLEITVWRNQDLSRLVQVRPDGRISLPLIGDVTAVGKTPTQLTAEISTKLKEYKENPSVAIVVKEVLSYAIFVLGEVGKPGKYPLKTKTTLLQGITIAGGFTPIAARNRLVVFRFNDNGANGSEKLKASYDDIVLRDGSQQNLELKPGDTIVVPSETMVLLP
jgi:polysaccharide export outer membrane protein